MTDYRDFAGSILSREIWNNEGRFWLILTLSILAIIAVVFLFARSYRNDSLMFASFSATVMVVGVIICVGIFGQLFTNDFNRIVAQHNVAAKYDDSKLQNFTYDAYERTLKARYTDKESNIREELTFMFKEDKAEPLLVKSNNSDDNFDKIEKTISKAE